MIIPSWRHMNHRLSVIIHNLRLVTAIPIGYLLVLVCLSSTSFAEPQKKNVPECDGFLTNSGCSKATGDDDLPKVHKLHCEDGGRSFVLGSSWKRQTGGASMVCRCEFEAGQPTAVCQPVKQSDLFQPIGSESVAGPRLLGSCLTLGKKERRGQRLCTCVKPHEGVNRLRWRCE